MRRKEADDLSRLVDGSPNKLHFEFTAQEIQNMITCLRHVFDLVCLVDPSRGCEVEIDESGNLVDRPNSQYSNWRTEEAQCNGMAMRALVEHTQLTEFEFVDEDLYHLTVRYVSVEGRSCTLEMISRVTDTTLLDGIGKPEIVEAISNHNTRMYIDPVTGVYNRRYYEDHFLNLNALRAVAMIDVDDFKHINDTYGHAVGDKVLNAIAAAINSCVRNTDVVIRFGGDEFVVIFSGLPREVLSSRIRGICNKVNEIVIEGHPELCASVSVGGAYGKDSLRKLIEEADRKMYIEKESKNRAFAAE